MDTALPTKKRDGARIKKLLRELSDDDMEDDVVPVTPTDPQKPWLPGFHMYLNTHDDLAGMNIVQWWGVSTSCFMINLERKLTLS